MAPQFSHWTSWGGRNQIDGSNLPGLYLLARFDDEPAAEVRALDEHVIYIGITERQTLRRRWDQFAASAFQRQLGHSGGWTFSAKFCNSEVCPAPAWLYVSAVPMGGDEVRRIKPLKQQLLAEFRGQHNRLPSCNLIG